MTDEEFQKEVHKLMVSVPVHWERVAWQVDYVTLRRMSRFYGLGIDRRTQETTLFELPIRLVHEPLSDKVPTDAMIAARRIDEFFVLSLICRGRKLGRTYYIDSEHCDELVRSELKKD